MGTVAAAVMGYRAGLPLMLETVSILRGRVDQMVVQADDLTEPDWVALETAHPGLVRVVYPWMEDFSDYRNHMVNLCTMDWTLALDHDEVPTEELAAGLRGAVAEAEHHRASLVGFKVLNEVIQPDGSRAISEGDGKDGMLIRGHVENPYRGDVHVWMAPKRWVPWRSGLHYRHIKTWLDVVERATRNIFMGGGGDTWKDSHDRSSPHWRPMRDWCAARGVSDYKAFLAYLRGPVDPWMADWLRKAAEQPWHDDEYRQVRAYYNHHHPEAPL